MRNTGLRAKVRCLWFSGSLIRGNVMQYMFYFYFNFIYCIIKASYCNVGNEGGGKRDGCCVAIRFCSATGIVV